MIERPANVLKELLENALDAGATRIDVEIRNNGLGLIRVSDNGHGILADQLTMAFGRHATSKIQAFDDLYRLNTFGFRGEALPSIASVSKMECVSWTKDQSEGGVIRFEGGLPLGVHSAGKTDRQHGTTMSIQDLFYNTPARLKFLQSATSEKNWIKKFFYAFILANPQVHFTFLWDDDERLIYSAVDSTAARLKQLYSSKAQDRLKIYSAKREWQGLTCEALMVQTFGARADGPIEHITVNGRPVLDKAYGRVAQQVLEKQQLSEWPQVLIQLTVPSNQVDVNVHPNKTMVKFHQMGEVLSLVSATLREALPQAEPQMVTTELPLNKTITPATDLERDRAASYADHLQRMQEQEPLPMVSTETTLLASTPGPYFLWQRPELEAPLYIDGRALLLKWITTQTEGEGTPLLVSHPLRDMKLSVNDLQKAQIVGFEIDELEENFFVVREIPNWSRGIPLSVLMPLYLKSLGHKVDCPACLYQEIPVSKWEEAFASQSVAQWQQSNIVVTVTPELFARK